jgi:hypothetical protein
MTTLKKKVLKKKTANPTPKGEKATEPKQNPEAEVINLKKGLTELGNAPTAPKIKKAKAEVKTDVDNTIKKSEGTVQYERLLAWKYPADMLDGKDRKLFRAKNRNKIRQLERLAVKAEGESLKNLKSQILALRTEVLEDPTRVF